MASKSKPECSINFWSSLTITALPKFGEIFFIETQSCSNGAFSPLPHCSIFRIIIKGVKGIGTQRKTITEKTESAIKKMMALKIHLKSFLKNLFIFFNLPVDSQWWKPPLQF